MGQRISFDFFRVVKSWLDDETNAVVDLEDHELWKTVFLTADTLPELAKMWSRDDARRLRRGKPHHLACLIYKCMQQMHIFIESKKAVAAGRLPKSALVGDKGVMNAVRIISLTMPYLFETDLVDDKQPIAYCAEDFIEQFFWRNSLCHSSDESATFPPLSQTKIPGLTDSAAATGAGVTLPQSCGTSAAEPATKYIPSGLASEGQPSGLAAGSGQRSFIPFAEQIFNLLLQLLALPGFTLEQDVKLRDVLDFTSDELRGHHVVPEYVFCPGLFKEHVAPGSFALGFDLLNIRYEIVRCLLTFFAAPAMAGDSMHPNPFLRVFTDVYKVPLGPTLCCSLTNYTMQYVSRGVVPYSSHYWAKLPEAFLTVALQLLTVCLDMPSNYVPEDALFMGASAATAFGEDAANAAAKSGDKVQPGARPTETEEGVPLSIASLAMTSVGAVSLGDVGVSRALDDDECDAVNNSGGEPLPTNVLTPAGARYYASDNSFWRYFTQIATDANLTDFIVYGLFKIIENPLYAATTMLSGSQRVIVCPGEALLFFWRLVSCPVTQSYRDAFARDGDAFIFPLVYYIQLGKRDRMYFCEMQASLYLLQAVSTHPSFSPHIAKPFGGKMPFGDLPALSSPNPTYGDVLCLALCDTMCPTAPRWVQPLLAGCACILANVSAALVLQESQCYELFHLLEFVTSTGFLRRSKKVDHEQVLLSVLDAVVNLCTYQAPTSTPLIASLGTTDIAARIETYSVREPTAVAPDAMTLQSIGDVTSGAVGSSAAFEHSESSDADRANRQFALTPTGRARAPLDAIKFFTDLANEHVPAQDSASQAQIDDAFATLAKEASKRRAAALTGPLVHRELQVTLPMLRWGTSALWVLIHRHNLRPPLYDVTAAKLFQ